MLARSFLFVLLSEIIFNLSGYVVHSAMGRILGPALYGRYGVVITLSTMIIILIGNGIPTAMAKYLSEIFEKKPGLIPVIKKQAALLQFILISLVTILFFLFSPFISMILGDPSLTSLFQISAFIIPSFALASFYFSYYTGLHKFKVQALLKTSRSLFRVVFIIGLALLLKSRGMALEGAIIGYIFVPLTIFFEARHYDSFRNQKPQGSFKWNKLLKYAWPVTLFMIAYEFLITIDLYMVKGLLKDDYLTGIYNATITVGRIPYYLFYALTIILLPAISKSTSSNNSKETKKLISQSLRLMTMFLIPICILMSTFSAPILQIFYSKRFLDATAPMSIFVFGIGFLTIYYVLTFVLNGAGKVKVPMYISFFGLALNIILTYFLISKYALLGAAWGTSITSFIVMIFSLVYTYKFFGYLFGAKSLLKIIFAGFLTYSISIIFPHSSLYSLIIGIFEFCFYIFTLYLLKEFGPFEINFFKSMLASRKSKISNP